MYALTKITSLPGKIFTMIIMCAMIMVMSDSFVYSEETNNSDEEEDIITLRGRGREINGLILRGPGPRTGSGLDIQSPGRPKTVSTMAIPEIPETYTVYQRDKSGREIRAYTYKTGTDKDPVKFVQTSYAATGSVATKKTTECTYTAEGAVATKDVTYTNYTDQTKSYHQVTVDGKLTKDERYDASGGLKSSTTKEYDTAGNVSKTDAKTYASGQMTANKVTECTYTAEGAVATKYVTYTNYTDQTKSYHQVYAGTSLVQDDRYYASGSPKTSTTKTYFDSGTLQSTVVKAYDSSGKTASTTTKTYDSTGALTKTNTVKNTYDASSGNMTKNTVTEVSYTGSAKTQQTVTTTEYTGDAPKTKTTTATGYDSATGLSTGRTVDQVTYDTSTGEPKTWITKTYNAAGKLTSTQNNNPAELSSAGARKADDDDSQQTSSDLGTNLNETITASQTANGGAIEVKSEIMEGSAQMTSLGIKVYAAPPKTQGQAMQDTVTQQAGQSNTSQAK